ncbi:MAG: hypothetical protein IJF83_08560 [Methanobrevibacter sp.]|nr:hypothetical protein [Methanobrevibacter sp.]MBR0371799.1 hypothetical protein [Methanobrevibacter sp.]
MADLIIQNPSITPNVFEYDEAGRVSAISGHPLAGEGGGTIVKSDLMWKPNVGNDGYVRWTLASSATTPGEAYISGAQGAPGQNGENGTSIVLQSVTDVEGGKQVTLAWGDDETPSTSSFVIPSGTNGKDGKDGTNGTSVYLDNVSTVAGGTQVTLGWGASDTSAFVIPSGAPGTNGQDGVSPLVTTSEISPTSQHPQGGTSVTITDKTGDHQFDVWNGINGQGATVNLLDGTGIHITNDGTNYTIAVSADYAAKSYVDSASAYALSQAESWVVTEGYLKEVPDEYALKTDIPKTVAQLTDSGNYYKKTETSGATEITNALSTKLDSTAAAQTYQTKSDMANYLTTSDASTTYQPKGNYASASDITDMATKTWVTGQGYLTAVPDSYATKTYANEASANAYDKAVAQIPTVTGFITKDADNLTYYYKKTETSGATELSTEFAKYVIKPDSSLVNKYLVLRTDNAGNVSGWCDFQDQSYSKSEANGTFVATANIDTTTLSGDGKSVSTKLGVKTDVIATKDWLDDNYLPLSGGTVTGDVIVKSTGTNILAVNTTATLMGQSRVSNLTDTTAIGTNWLGVNSNGGGFLKNVQGGNVGDLNGTSIQINFAPDGANSYGNITVNSQGNESKIINVPTASYNSMSSFDNTNGPNYMLRKTAGGFDIGACVINVTEVPTATEANTYYFVYDIV